MHNWECFVIIDKKAMMKVFKALAEGKKESDIPKFYDVLELYPKDG